MTIVIRPARLDDAAAVANIRNALWQVQAGHLLTDAEWTRQDWLAPGFDVARRVGLAVDAVGETVGFVWLATWDVDSVVLHLGARPDEDGGRVRERLLDWAEARTRGMLAQDGIDEPFPVYVRVAPGDDETAHVLDHRGYRLYRMSVEMRITLGSAPPTPRWPEGVTPTVLVPNENEHAVHATISEAFETNWEGDRVPPFETWRHETLADVGYDPTLWVVAVDAAGEVVGALGGTALWRGQVGVGGLFDFGVRPAWRGRGLGRAILLQALWRFYGRGYHTVALSVDAHNTPAVALYDSVGMRETYRSAIYAHYLADTP